MSDKTKCAHKPCTCSIKEAGQYGKYCSEHCKEAADAVTEVFCDCHHPGCRGENS